MFILPPDAARPAGRTYTVREVIHRGQHATLYLADLCAAGRFARQVALKVLNPDSGPDELARLRDEARMLGLLRHRAIIGALGMSSVDGRPAIVMEAAAGADLAALVARGPLPLSAALEIVEEVAGALDLAWRAPREDGQPLRLCHRAIGLRAVRVSAEGGVKVLGFDFARAELTSREGKTRVITAPLAPEQQRGAGGAAADIFALGALLYHLAHGRPLPRLSARPDQQAAQLAAALDALNTQEPARSGVVGLLSAMLSFEAGSRPSAREVLRRVSDLRRLASGPSLTTWAAGAVPAARATWRPMTADGLVGRSFDERSGAHNQPESKIIRRVSSSPLRLLPWAALSGILSVGGLGAAGFALLTLPRALRTILGALGIGS